MWAIRAHSPPARAAAEVYKHWAEVARALERDPEHELRVAEAIGPKQGKRETVRPNRPTRLGWRPLVNGEALEKLRGLVIESASPGVFHHRKQYGEKLTALRPKKQQRRRRLRPEARAGRSRKGPRAALAASSDRESSARKNQLRNRFLRSPALLRTRSTPAPSSQIAPPPARRLLRAPKGLRPCVPKNDGSAGERQQRPEPRKVSRPQSKANGYEKLQQYYAEEGRYACCHRRRDSDAPRHTAAIWPKSTPNVAPNRAALQPVLENLTQRPANSLKTARLAGLP
jgi:hypothetical protein